MTNQEKLYVYVVETSTYVDYEGQIEIKVNHFRKREKAEAFFDSISKGYEKSSETYETFSEGELLKSSFLRKHCLTHFARLLEIEVK